MHFICKWNLCEMKESHQHHHHYHHGSTIANTRKFKTLCLYIQQTYIHIIHTVKKLCLYVGLFAMRFIRAFV